MHEEFLPNLIELTLHDPESVRRNYRRWLYASRRPQPGPSLNAHEPLHGLVPDGPLKKEHRAGHERQRPRRRRRLPAALRGGVAGRAFVRLSMGMKLCHFRLPLDFGRRPELSYRRVTRR